MRFPSFFSVVGAAVLSVSASLSAATPAAAQARTPLFTADQEACFGRVYDQSHLAGHPDQKVTGIHIFRSLSERPEAENWRPNQREETIKRFRETGETSVQAFVTFRDRRGYFHNALTCNKETKNGVGCYIECDGGSFDLKRESPTTALLHNNGFVLIGGCGEEVDESQMVYFSPGKDDKVFRLESKPAGICRTEEQRARPIRAGKPLRERFGEKEPFCFGRDYDAAHRAKHPQQKVTSIRVGRLTPDQERLDKDNPQQWPEDVKLSVSLILNAGAARRAAKYACLPQEASWECYAELLREHAVDLRRQYRPARARPGQRHHADQSPGWIADRHRLPGQARYRADRRRVREAPDALGRQDVPADPDAGRSVPVIHQMD